MSILVDSSIWIDYFRGNDQTGTVDLLIDENLVFTNDLILAELVPALQVRRQRSLVALLHQIKRSPLAIDWQEIIAMQTTCLRNGVNGVGIPDLIIAQNAIQNGLNLLSVDRHFELMSRYLSLSLYEN
ncbi:MAG: PIN domain-containing protein [Candidatus Latescibacteria bacterium]|nr:PIN domain-containing protein [Candidatus Latescibacterota bacterium]